MSKVIETARTYIGKLEKPGNSGFKDPAFEVEMKNEGWQKGWAWCAVFVKLVLKKALPEKATEIDKHFTAGCVDTYKRCIGSPFAVTPLPVPGCVVVWQQYDDFNKQWQGHMGIVTSFKYELANGKVTPTFETIEGNTSANGSRNGDRVWEHRTRKIDFKEDGLNVLGFIRVE